MSSTIQASTYDYPAAITASDTDNDPAGPFVGLYVSVAGVLKCTPLNGPLSGSSLTINVVAGGYVCFPVKRIWSGTTTATVVGLVSSAVVQQGFQ